MLLRLKLLLMMTVVVKGSLVKEGGHHSLKCKVDTNIDDGSWKYCEWKHQVQRYKDTNH